VIDGDSLLYRWNGEEFVLHQTLEDSGGRELAALETAGGLFLIRVNFITGGRENPTTDLRSQIYRWDAGKLTVVEEFTTWGGTDAAVLADGDDVLLAVSNSLTPDLHFSTESVIYRFEG
jgi:hypothetical protein